MSGETLRLPRLDANSAVQFYFLGNPHLIFRMFPAPGLRSWYYQILERDAGQSLRPSAALTPILCGMTSSSFSQRHVLPLSH